MRNRKLKKQSDNPKTDNWQLSQGAFKKNLYNFRAMRSKKEGKSPSSILTNQDIYIICLHDYSDPKELEKVAISKEKKEKYEKIIIAAYNDAFKR